MATWDVFRGDRLEAERSLTTKAVLDALSRGDLGEDDLVRPAGTTRWTRLGDSPDFADRTQADTFTPPEATEFATYDSSDPPPAGPAFFEPPSVEDDDDEDDSAESDMTRFEVDPAPDASIERQAILRAEIDPNNPFDRVPDSGFKVFDDDEEEEDEPAPAPFRKPSSSVAMPVLPDDQEVIEPDLDEVDGHDEYNDLDAFDPQDEDDEAASFTLSRNSAETVEELDLAAMVDVAFQLVLFFLVTAQVLVYKTLEIPRPGDEKPPEAAAQARAKTIDELEKDSILVEVDAGGSIKIDHIPVPADRPTMTEKLRKSRESTGRKDMLLSTDFATQHKNAVLVLDIARDIGLSITLPMPAAKGADANKAGR